MIELNPTRGVLAIVDGNQAGRFFSNLWVGLPHKEAARLMDI